MCYFSYSSGLRKKIIERPNFSKKIPAEKRQELIRIWSEDSQLLKGENEQASKNIMLALKSRVSVGLFFVLEKFKSALTRGFKLSDLESTPFNKEYLRNKGAPLRKLNMNKDVNPIVVLVVLVLVLCPLFLWGWASGEKSLQAAGSFYLEITNSGQLSIQVDHLLVIQDELNLDAQSIDLGKLGIESPKGNVTYFKDGDLLVRAGPSANNLFVYLTLQEDRSSQGEAIQQELTKLKKGEEFVLKCNRELDQCKRIGSLSAPWHHRLFIDDEHQFIYLIDGLGHEVRSYNQDGILLSSLKSGLRYPKRIRCFDETCYLIDTNNRRLLILNKTETGSLDVLEELYFEHLDGGFNWIIDAHYIEGSWWVISADNSMRTSKAYIFDSEGSLKKQLELNIKAEPFDLLLKGKEVLISDIASGRIYKFDIDGSFLGEVGSKKVVEYYEAIADEREKFELYVSYSKVFLALVIILGIGLSIMTLIKPNDD